MFRAFYYSCPVLVVHHASMLVERDSLSPPLPTSELDLVAHDRVCLFSSVFLRETQRKCRRQTCQGQDGFCRFDIQLDLPTAHDASVPAKASKASNSAGVLLALAIAIADMHRQKGRVE